MSLDLDWITAATRHVADACGLDPSSLAVRGEEADVLLELAGVAAHRSGARTNAPLLCFALGRATAQGAALDVLARAVREIDNHDTTRPDPGRDAR